MAATTGHRPGGSRGCETHTGELGVEDVVQVVLVESEREGLIREGAQATLPEGQADVEGVAVVVDLDAREQALLGARAHRTVVGDLGGNVGVGEQRWGRRRGR
jgi:hypothetical protein